MVNQSPDARIDETFGALADATRRAMIMRLLEGEATVSELAAPHSMSLPAVLKHVARLVDAGLVNREKRGRTVVCTLDTGPLDEANAWLQHNLDAWNTRFDALDSYLASQQEKNP